MPKAKLLIAENMDIYCDNFSHNIEIIHEGITDWEEISEEDYTLLSKYLNILYKDVGTTKLILVRQDTVPLLNRKKTIVEYLDKAKKVQEDYERRKEEKMKHRQETKKAKTASSVEEERKLLAKLKKKYEET